MVSFLASSLQILSNCPDFDRKVCMLPQQSIAFSGLDVEILQPRPIVRTFLIAETIRYLQKLLKPLPARFMAACPMHGSHKPTLK
jgi:hypothetical protein